VANLDSSSYSLPTEAKASPAALEQAGSLGARDPENLAPPAGWFIGKSAGLANASGGRVESKSLLLYDMPRQLWEWCRTGGGVFRGTNYGRGYEGNKSLKSLHPISGMHAESFVAATGSAGV